MIVSDLLNVSSGPHVRSKLTTGMIMGIVIIALLPATCYGIYHFGVNAAILVAVCVVTCVAAEVLYELILKLPVTIGDVNC